MCFQTPMSNYSLCSNFLSIREKNLMYRLHWSILQNSLLENCMDNLSLQALTKRGMECVVLCQFPIKSCSPLTML